MFLKLKSFWYAILSTLPPFEFEKMGMFEEYQAMLRKGATLGEIHRAWMSTPAKTILVRGSTNLQEDLLT